MALKRGRNKTKTKKSRFYSSKITKTLRSIIIKLLVTVISLLIFMLVIYKAYNYYVKPIDLKNIPYIKNNKICDKIKFNENDGIIFSNQDKKVYDSLKQKKRDSYKQNLKSEKVIQDFSHKQIFDIVQEIKKDEFKEDQKSKSKPVIEKKNISNKIKKKKMNTQSIFDVLE
jgi:hypothetical protein